MQAMTTIGRDIAKSVFQVHGVDAAGNVVVRRQGKRRYVPAFFQKLSPCKLLGDPKRPFAVKDVGHAPRPAWLRPLHDRARNMPPQGGYVGSWPISDVPGYPRHVRSEGVNRTRYAQRESFRFRPIPDLLSVASFLQQESH